MPIPKPFVRKLVEKANQTRNSTGSVRRVMAQGDVVFGIWQDETEPYGVGIHCIKGHNLLREVIATDKGKQVSIIAIPCVSAGQAIAPEDGRRRQDELKRRLDVVEPGFAPGFSLALQKQKTRFAGRTNGLCCVTN